MANETTEPHTLVPDFPTRVMLIERGILFLLVAGLLGGVLVIVTPFTTAVLFGTAIAAAAWPLRQALVHRGVGRGLAAALLFVLSVMVVLLPLMVIAPHLADRIGEAIQRFEAFFRAAPAKPAWIEGLPLVGARLGAAWERMVQSEGDLRVLVAPYIGDVEQVLIGTASGLANSLLQVLLSLIAATVFWTNGDELLRTLHEALSRLGGPVAERAIEVSAGAIRGVAYGVIGTAFIQAMILTIGLAAAGVPGAGMLGFIALLLAISQIGAPLLIAIWGGAAWWLFRQDYGGWGSFMIVWGLFTSTVDNIIRPWLIGLGLGVPLSLTLLGVFGGFIAFGFLGLFIGPTLIAVVYTLFSAWRSAIAVHPATASVKPGDN